MIVTLDSKRRFTVPAALVSATPGDEFEMLYDEEEDAIVLRRVREKKEDWLDVMQRCPVPMDDLPPRSRELPKELAL